MFGKRQFSDEEMQKIREASGHFTAQELDHIKTLPMRKIRYADTECTVLYDEKALTLYTLDDHGVPTGEVRTLKKPLPPLKNETHGKQKKAAFFHARADSAKSAGAENRKTDDAGDAVKERLLKGVLLALAALIVLGGGFLGMRSIAGRGRTQKDNTPAAEEQRVSVIKLNHSVLAGTQLQKEYFEKESITNDKYNEFCATGYTPYTWDYVDTLADMYAVTFIPQDTQYLSTGNVSGVQPIYSNPFRHTTDSESVLLDVPVNISYGLLPELVIGRRVDIKIEKVTVSSANEKLETPDVSDMTQSSRITERTRTDVYGFQDVAILDLINTEGTSLYEVFSHYNSVPDGILETYLDDELTEKYRSGRDVGMESINDIFPQFHVSRLVIEVTQDQAKAIGKMTPENTTVTISNLQDTYVSDTAGEIEFAAETRFTAGVLSMILTKLEKQR